VARVGILGVPFQSAGRPYEVARGPGALRAAGLVAALAESHEVHDSGDVALPRPRGTRDPASGVIDPERLSVLVRAVRDDVARIVADGRFPLVIGGDCPLLLGCLWATRAGLLHVDGHEDAYLPAQSPSGAAADMEIAFALGLAELGWDEELRAAQPWLDPSRLALLGPRDRPDLERLGVESLAGRVELVAAEALAADPAGAVERAAARVGRFWLHLDWDVMATDEMAAVTISHPGGLDWNGLAVVIAAALGHPGVVGWDIAVYNPDLDPDGRYAVKIVEFVSDALRALR
jgi:arginase